MGNDTRFVEPDDLPFRLIEEAVGSAPSGPCLPPRSSHTQHKRHAPPPPPPCFAGYDAPPSLPPPPILPKRSDQRTPIAPRRTDRSPPVPAKTTSQYPLTDVQRHRRKYDHKRHKRSCCVIS